MNEQKQLTIAKELQEEFKTVTFGNLLPIISDTSASLDNVFETVINMNTVNLTPETVPSGFAKEKFCQQTWFI